jgi:hypothetical protein
MEINEIWYGRHATGDYQKLIIFNFPPWNGHHSLVCDRKPVSPAFQPS